MKRSNLQQLCRLAMLGGLALSSTAFAAPLGHTGGAGLAAIDTNGDGKISVEENAAVATKMFNFLDANKDGKLTSAEMDAVQARIAAKTDAKPRMNSAEKIRAVDTNGDGVITADENAAMSKAMFDKMDNDKDGFVSAEERAALRAKMSQKQ